MARSDEDDNIERGMHVLANHAQRMRDAGRITDRELQAVRSHIAQSMFERQDVEQYVAMKKAGTLQKLLDELAPRKGQDADAMHKERGEAFRKVQAGFLVDGYEAGAFDERHYVEHAKALGIVPEDVAKLKDPGEAATELWSRQRDPDHELPDPPEKLPSWAHDHDDKVSEEWVHERRKQDLQAEREWRGDPKLEPAGRTPSDREFAANLKREESSKPKRTADPSKLSMDEYAKAREEGMEMVMPDEPAAATEEAA